MGSLNLNETAARLGVHYQTAYRWVRQGSLSATKVGGTYEVELSAVEELLEHRSRPVPPRQRRLVRDWAPFACRLHRHLISGDELAARDLLAELVGGGVGLVDVCDHIMVPALIRIGQEWMDHELSVGEEHRASAICARMLGRLGVSPPGRPRGVAMVCCAPGDDHRLPAEMATAALREDHWRVHHLGGGVGADEVAEMALDEHAELVVVSVTWPPASAGAESLATSLAGPGRTVLVGGPGKSLSTLTEMARRR